jgi:tRNA A37 N6-isopentenylltransferase MiaA
VSSPTASAAIGYRQTLNYLCRLKHKEGDARALTEYIDHFATVTRNYAKRQLHWYRKDTHFLWIHDTFSNSNNNGNNNSNNNNNKNDKTNSKSPSGAARRIAEEMAYWVYKVSKEDYSTNLSLQVGIYGRIQH